MDLWTFFEVHGPEVAARRLVRLVLVCRRSVLLHCLNHTLMWLTGSSCSDCEVAAMILYGQTVCSAGGGRRMERSSGLVPGFQPVCRKSGVVVDCHSERPLRVQCDGQSTVGLQTLALCISGFVDSFIHCV